MTVKHSTPRVAIVHEWLIDHSGSEKVVEQMLHLYPQADLFSVVDFLAPGERGFLQGKTARTTFIQRLPFARKHFRSYLPLMPLAVEQHDLSAYDIVLSSNHAVAKGVITGPHQLHVCYVHSPIRYAWDLQHQYLRESGLTTGLKAWLARLVLHRMRLWDVASANRVDAFIANSAFIARRVHKVYRRDAAVIHPPVDVARFQPGAAKGDFFLAASRLVPYKHMPMIVRAFARLPQHRLVVIGDGPDMARVRAAAGPNVQVLGYQDGAVLIDHMQRARALVFAAEEDFGITPVEAQACGTPVIAYGRGGALETVRGLGHGPAPTGLWYPEQTEEAVADAVLRFDAAASEFTTAACRDNAEQFSVERFRSNFSAYVDAAWVRFRDDAATPAAPTSA
jgi:glycosyltransferase involved in cell wall biosynthesis